MDFKAYVAKFNANDEECYKQLIPNESALDFLLENAPRLSCPDEVIEETFAFRTWTLRKHFKETEDGLVLTEFLPKVPWSSTHNTINAPLFHHLNESRWFRNSDRLLDYISLFLDGKANAFAYTTPALWEMLKFLKVTDNLDYAVKNVEKFEAYVRGFEVFQLKNGLFCSIDNQDAMEVSISGTVVTDTGFYAPQGIRPTMNGYMYGAYVTMAEIEMMCGREDKAAAYTAKAEELREHYNRAGFDGDFYKAIHIDLEALHGDVTTDDIPDGYNARELIGYIPFIYGLAGPEQMDCLKYLKDETVFAGQMGLTTADISHPKFLYEFGHTCLWNGYVWPYASSQTITAAINVLERSNPPHITHKDVYDFIRKYAEMHYRMKDGKKINHIDEVMSPYELVWTSRELLKLLGWMPQKGGYERGKDYNHSTFIDLVIRGLIGVKEDAETLTVEPHIQGIWPWFKLENLTFRKKSYDIYYDEDGSHLGKGVGVVIEERV